MFQASHCLQDAEKDARREAVGKALEYYRAFLSFTIGMIL